MFKDAAGGSSIPGASLGVQGTATGVAVRPDRQSREEIQPIMEAGPFVAVADRLLEEHDWCLSHPNVVALAAEFGGTNSHAGVVARERKIPGIIGKGVAQIGPGDTISVDGSAGYIHVNGGGFSPLPQGEGDPVKNFVWFNQSWMISDVNVQGHDEMTQYMQSFGLWGATGVMGTIFDNGYAQVSPMPPPQEEDALLKTLRSQVPEVQTMGAESPTKGKFQPPADHPALQTGQAPGMQAQEDRYRFVYQPTDARWSPVDPTDPNKHGTTHQDMIAEMQAAGTFDWTTAMTQGVPCGIVYNTGNVEIFCEPLPAPEDQKKVEDWARQQFGNEAHNFDWVQGGMVNVMGSTKKSTLPQTIQDRPDHVEPTFCPRCGSKGEFLRGNIAHCFNCGANYDGLHGEDIYDESYKTSADEDKALRCPECGSHTLRGESLDKEDGQLHCLSCGNTFKAKGLVHRQKREWKISGKLDKGQRIEMTHQKFKGQRGTILEHKKTDKDFEEEVYSVLLDNGTELEEVSDTDFKKIRSAAIEKKELNSDTLPQTCYMCGNERSANLEEACGVCEFDPKEGTNKLPTWHISTVLAADGAPVQTAIGATMNGNVQNIHMYDTSQQTTPCGIAVNTLQQPVRGNTAIQNVPCPTCFAQRNSHVKLSDTEGDPIQVGSWYTMYSENWTVPDVLHIMEIGDDKTITAAIEGDDKGLFPLRITPDEIERNQYRFEPYVHETLEARNARRNFSVTEQNEFINENMEGRARNIDKLDLSGTHYEQEDTNWYSIQERDSISHHFLW
jgi:phosphohistidine swiveling domain-containing protein/DNA-directed RNA polymerase subunit M/transcription elongation factor TFIIS